MQTEDLTEGFHTFGVNWQKDTLEWYVDGAKVVEMITPADMHKPMYMLVNLAVGDTGSWPGKYNASMPTTHLEVDHVANPIEIFTGMAKRWSCRKRRG